MLEKKFKDVDLNNNKLQYFPIKITFKLTLILSQLIFFALHKNEIVDLYKLLKLNN